MNRLHARAKLSFQGLVDILGRTKYEPYNSGISIRAILPLITQWQDFINKYAIMMLIRYVPVRPKEKR